MAQGGTCSCPSDTGAFLCTAKTQGRTGYCSAEGRPRPRNRPPWVTLCTCNDWKAGMLLDKTQVAVAIDPNCHCPSMGRPRPNNLHP